MPLPGGSTDKLGNRYELRWTISELTRILHGEADSIRLEDPGVEKAEFTIMAYGRKELHQVKLSHPSGNWSISSLAATELRVLQAMFAQLSGNANQFIFVSGSDARELKELTERARQSESLEEFKETFLGAKQWQKEFEKLQKFWMVTSDQTSYEVLKRIEIRIIDEQTLKKFVDSRLQGAYLADSETIYNELAGLALESIHKTLSRQILIDYLEKRGFRLRTLANKKAAPNIVSEVAKRYLDDAKRRLIQKTLIPRSATPKLFSHICDPQAASNAVLLGTAGSGKTGCVVELVECLQTHGFQVLPLRLDRLTPHWSTAEIGRQLGFEESPALLLAAAAEGQQGVLIIDQLDAVSTTSGRSADFLNVVELLLNEIRGLQKRNKLHVILVCRVFDWKNDQRLRKLALENPVEVKIDEFSPDEVKNVLTSADFNLNDFQPKQLELLRLPQNLSLFLDVGFNPSQPFPFRTSKDLFDRYWKAKCQTVADRAGSDQWINVITGLCQEMTRTQQLSIPKEKLDLFSSDYVDQMTSEGVLTFDGKRYGFDHESFFDYCFARTFVAKEQPLVDFLVESEQHLFRRAQVRQVLAYLRDYDRKRYCAEVHSLLNDTRVRIHLKDLALAVLTGVPDPKKDEWDLIKAWLELQLVAFKEKCQADKFVTLVWQHFFRASSWFYLADQLGLVAAWLASENEPILNMGIKYVRFHQRHAGDRVAELLESYIGQGQEWKKRLKYVVHWADFEHSRRFFELFLKLIDDGTLDDASSETSLSMLHDLSKAHPEWFIEALAHYLSRLCFLICQEPLGDRPTRWRGVLNENNSSLKEIHEAAQKCPKAFVQQILPVVLEISDKAVYKLEAGPPYRDWVWLSLLHNSSLYVKDVCLDSLVTALKILAVETPEFIRPFIELLGQRQTFIANYLLLSIYTANNEYFADESVPILCEQPWRLYCGCSDSPYWFATELVQKVALSCSEDNFKRLEELILKYDAEPRRTRTDLKFTGFVQFTFLSALPVERRSPNIQRRVGELERKFEKPYPAPQGIVVRDSSSPIAQESADKMTDKQWLRAIAKYDSERRSFRHRESENGGAWELALMLGEFVKQEPERFARLVAQFTSQTHPAYFDRVMVSLKEASIPPLLKLDVCRKAFAKRRNECGQAIADLLESLEDPLPEDAIQMLIWLATQHPDPESEGWKEKTPNGQPYYNGDIFTFGINTTRGQAAEALGTLIFRDESYIAQFHSAIEHLLTDRSIAVRSCTAKIPLAIARHNDALAIQLFTQLLATDDKLLETQWVQEYLNQYLRPHFATFRPFIERMLRSSEPEMACIGGQFAGLANLYHEDAVDLVRESMAGNSQQRLGIAKVAAQNIAQVKCSDWCESHLLEFFNDPDPQIRREAASCFRKLKQENMESFENLISIFCDSAAFQEDSMSILLALEKSPHRLPGIVCTVCEKFLARFSDEAKDIQTHKAGDVYTVTKLAFRTYHQHQEDEWTGRSLNLIDQICLEGVGNIAEGFKDFER